MSTQPPSIILGPRVGVPRDGSVESDLQQLVGKVLEILSRRRWLFLLPALTGTLVVLVGGLLIPRQYSAASTFERRDDVVVTSLVQGHTPYSLTTLRQNLQVDLISSNAVARAAAEIGLFDDLPRDEAGNLTAEGRRRERALVAKLTSQLSFRVTNRGATFDTIQVTYLGGNPELGEQLVTKLVNNYIARMDESITGVIRQAHAFFRREADERRDHVGSLVWKQIQFALDHPGVNPTDPDVLDRRLTAERVSIQEIDRRRGETQSRIAAHEEYLAELKGHPRKDIPVREALPGGPPEAMTINPRRERIQQEIEEIEEKISDLRVTQNMTDHHPTMQSTLKRLELRRRELADTAEWIPATDLRPMPVMDTRDPWAAEQRRIEMELKSLQELMAQLDTRRIEHQTEIERTEKEKQLLHGRRETFLSLQQDLDNIKSDLKIWDNHAETLSRVLVAADQNRGMQFAVLSDARATSLPQYPTLLGIYLLCIGIGVALGTVAVFLRELLDRSFRNPARVRQELGIPVLETIREIRLGRPSGWRDRRLLLSSVAMVETMAILAVSLLVYISLHDPGMYQRIISRTWGLLPL